VLLRDQRMLLLVLRLLLCRRRIPN